MASGLRNKLFSAEQANAAMNKAHCYYLDQTTKLPEEYRSEHVTELHNFIHYISDEEQILRVALKAEAEERIAPGSPQSGSYLLAAEIARLASINSKDVAYDLKRIAHDALVIAADELHIPLATNLKIKRQPSWEIGYTSSSDASNRYHHNGNGRSIS